MTRLVTDDAQRADAPRQEAWTRLRLRAVTAGVWATVLILAVLVAYPWAPGATVTDLVGYVALLGIAAAGAAIVASLPWGRLFKAGWGTPALHAWSILDILLITGIVVLSGGAESPLLGLYVLTTVFSATVHAPRAQGALLLFTVTCAIAGATWAGGNMFAAVPLFHLGLITVTAWMAGFLSRELIASARGHEHAAGVAARRATMLAEVARASRRLNALEHDQVLDEAVVAVERLGLEAASLCLLEPGGQTYKVVRAHNLPAGYRGTVKERTTGITGRVLETRAPVVMHDYGTSPHGVPALQAEGFRSAVAAPVWTGGELVGALVGGTRATRRIDVEDVEALQLLAAQVGLALQNARAFGEQREVAQRLSELDELKSQFLQGISHELRTPVSVVAGMTRTLERRWQDLTEGERRGLLTSITGSAETLQSAVATLLDFSRLRVSPGRRREPVTLMSLVEEALGQVVHLIQGHELRIDVPCDLAVRVDPELMRRALEHLLANAALYTPSGSLIWVRATPGGDDVRIEVLDEGPGIAAHDLEHLGERFYRGGEPNSRPAGGLGLGLALVQEVLTAHEAELMVDSELGRGARFGFSLPLG